MTRRIEEDWQHFRDTISGKLNKALRKHMSTGNIFPMRGKGGKVSIALPKINIPHIVYGSNKQGIGRGPAKKGDVIKKGDEQGQGNQAGEGEGEGIIVNVDIDYVLDLLQEELALPELKPKEGNIDEKYLKYNSLSLQGPNSLRHPRKTLQQALKRAAAAGDLNKFKIVPNCDQPIPLISIQKNDFRYRQYTEHSKPFSNAVVFFARDGSASMDQDKCDIISNMSWWIDAWINKFYKKVERVFLWHDWVAQEVDEEKFYKYRYGGGTMCSSAMQLISEQFENRFPPHKWNIYVFYFTDGENIRGDNQTFVEIIKKSMPPDRVNFIGITQIYNQYGESLKKYIDNETIKNLITTSIGENSRKLSEEALGQETKKAIKDLLGKKKEKV